LTEYELKQYQNLLREIDNQESRIDALYGKEVPVVAGKVNASSKYFPYIPFRVSVQMEDPTIASEIDKLVKQKRKRIEECWKQAHKIEEFIRAIPESELRQIFEYRYIDGKKQWEIAAELHIDRSRISRKISDYLQNAHKAQKSNV